MMYGPERIVSALADPLEPHLDMSPLDQALSAHSHLVRLLHRLPCRFEQETTCSLMNTGITSLKKQSIHFATHPGQGDG